MKCPICGRENPDIRLFCMQCGELLPETEEASAASRPADNARIYEGPEPEKEPEAVAEDAGDAQTAKDEREALPLDAVQEDDMQFYRERRRTRGIIEEAWPEEASAPEMRVPPASIFDEPNEAPQSSGSHYARPDEYADSPRRPVLDRQTPASGRANTYIPKRESQMDPDDFFAVRGQVLPEYDEDPEERPRRRRREGDFEDGRSQSFAVRHMRGLVTLLLLALTIAIVVVWANTDAAQYTLAKVDMAWKSSAYAELAVEAYAAKDLSAAGYYYTAALKRDADNYNYAVMAANSYIEGGYTSKALEALRTCISINPTNADLYVMLIQLQPDTALISDSDRQLIKTGYEFTGDGRLNIE